MLKKLVFIVFLSVLTSCSMGTMSAKESRISQYQQTMGEWVRPGLTKSLIFSRLDISLQATPNNSSRSFLGHTELYIIRGYGDYYLTFADGILISVYISR